MAYEIPIEILLKIFSYIPLKNLYKLRLVCTKWKEVIDYKLAEDNLHFPYFCNKKEVSHNPIVSVDLPIGGTIANLMAGHPCIGHYENQTNVEFNLRLPTDEPNVKLKTEHIDNETDPKQQVDELNGGMDPKIQAEKQNSVPKPKGNKLAVQARQKTEHINYETGPKKQVDEHNGGIAPKQQADKQNSGLKAKGNKLAIQFINPQNRESNTELLTDQQNDKILYPNLLTNNQNVEPNLKLHAKQQNSGIDQTLHSKIQNKGPNPNGIKLAAQFISPQKSDSNPKMLADQLNDNFYPNLMKDQPNSELKINEHQGIKEPLDNNIQENNVFENHIPDEILLKIFSYIPMNDLLKFRSVCTKWRENIDYKISEDNLQFYYMCKDEFPESYTSAFRHASLGMSYFDVYKNLKSWKLMNKCNETVTALIPSSQKPEIISTSLIGDVNKGVLLAVHKTNEIVYYDMNHKVHKTMKGRFLKHVETMDFITSLDFYSNLHIIWKKNRDPLNNYKTLNGITHFLLYENVLHLYDGERFYECNLDLEEFKVKPIFEYHGDTLVSLGCKDDKLVSLWGHQDEEIDKFCFLYVLHGDHRYHISTDVPILLFYLRRNDLIDNMNWRQYNFFHDIMSSEEQCYFNPLKGPLSDITTAKSYGDHLFIGSYFGILKIYYAPFSVIFYESMDPEKMVPVKQYQFIDSNSEIQCTYPIVKIDIVEVENGHRLYVAMPQKLVVIDYKF